MGTRQLKRDIKALLGDYIGQKLRENGFDPKGKGTFSLLDDLAHYDLAASMALWWLEKYNENSPFESELVRISPGQYPNQLEREAMILSSFAGILLNSLPVEDILSLYSCKPSASCPDQDTKRCIVHPFSLSYHPFAMLGSFKAFDHSRKHTEKLKRWNAKHSKVALALQENVKAPSLTPSSHSFSDSEGSLKEQAKHSEGSQDTLQD
ncbi:uncharacterized protein C2orf80 [Brachyhypopomus gauderio]|uniref:uncharacterized protein C2orf80 n=1 Tax=Brachyhypopomus gauderio TaxID=698409 RepID=UPI004042EA7B